MLKYRLIKDSLNDEYNVQKTILLNRGVENWKEYLNIDESCINDYSMLDNIHEAVLCYISHLDRGSKIHVIVDPDVDGFCSASEIIRYTKKINSEANITYSLHTQKQHGISEDITIPEDIDLLIVPDAGSNDVIQCKELNENGIDVIVLDHHICDKKNPYAIVVNNQMCDYPNKNFCGGGIVYKFLKAVDDELWENYADDFLDMVALSNISDVMDMREFETRYYVNTGLNKIRSKVFKALIDKQSYSMKDVVNIISVQFYVTPILNAMIRVGNQDDKDLLFRAFIETDEVFKYKKRGATEETDEDIYTRAARLCYNAKNRQGKEVSKSVDEIDNIIKQNELYKNKAIFVNVSNVLSQTLTGLVAMKIADKYNKPCLLLRRQKLRDDGGMFYGGSCRNFDHSPIGSLKNELDSTNLFEFVQGHDNAAGFSINRNNVEKAISRINTMWKNIDFTAYYEVDFDKDVSEIDISFVKEIDDIKDLFGQGIKEPYVHISNIPVVKEDTFVMGKESNSWKVIYNDELAFVKFSVDKEKDAIINSMFSDTDGLLGTMDVVGTVSLNNYKGILTPQVIVKDYEFK
nr:MAG TPA: single-stranded-DNA-specific exonuclease RecJ [Caudoviricetes sp.]